MTKYAKYLEIMEKINDIEGAIALLSWDKEVNIIPENSVFRARQIALLSKLAHEMFTSQEFGNLLEELITDKNLNEKQKINVEKTYAEYLKQKKLPPEFIEEFAEATSRAFHAWYKAKKEKKIEIFLPHLEHILNLVRQKTFLLGFHENPYDGLLDSYEEGLRTKFCDEILLPLKDKIKEITHKILSSGKKINDAFLKRNYPIEKQREFNKFLILQMGFNLKAGNISEAPHPFTTQISLHDARITTAYSKKDLTKAIFSTIHEFGHSLYDALLPEDQYGLPCGETMGMIIHESQSKIWENNIGHSIEFWTYFYPILRAFFYEQLENVNLHDFYLAINVVKPSLIRIYADEITYHLHIIIRYEIEKALVNGDISLNELPKIWNEKYLNYIGIEPKNDAEGILQDIHWSSGAIGYFATYSLGTLLAAQLYEKAISDLPEIPTEISKGNFSKIRKWLNDNIFSHGKRYSFQDLIKKATGKPLSLDSFFNYIKTKYEKIYEIPL